MLDVYQIGLTRSAEKAYRKLPASVRGRIGEGLREVAADPRRRHPQVKALVGGLAGLLRLRVRDGRVIYRLEHERLVVLVVRIGARGDVYD